VKFILLTCATASESWSEEAEQLYTNKLKPFIPFEIKHLKIKKASRDDRELKLKSDSDALIAEIKPDDFVVVFDERGDQLESRKFAQKIESIMNSGKKRAVFVIGGAYGVDDRIRSRAQLKVGLSKMVFNHLIAQTVVLEQIYRGFAIIKNLPYHND
jgi:23S rRNA (pseudouridine1915-N3)-methyltransferase